MNIKRVSLAWVSVADFAKSKKFFTETLGLTVTEEDTKFGWLELQGQKKGSALGVCQAMPDKGMPAGVNAVVTFVVDDYEGSKKELAGKGITLFGEIAGYPGVPRMVNFKDLDGNMFQLVEETPGETDQI